MSRYEWKKKSFCSGDAQAVGETLEQITEDKGSLTPDLVVDQARDSSSPLHRYFEWDDTAAAQKHREGQARTLIRSVRVVAEEAPVSKPAFVHVKAKGVSEYQPIAVAVKDKDIWQSVIDNAESDLISLRERLDDLRRVETEPKRKEKTGLIVQSLDSAVNQVQTPI